MHSKGKSKRLLQQTDVDRSLGLYLKRPKNCPAQVPKKQKCIEAKNPVEPSFLIGRKVAVKWDDGIWYNGTVTGYVEETFEHTIEYVDGDKEQLVVGLHIPVKVHVGPLEKLPLPSSQHLLQLSQLLLQQADRKQKEATGVSGPAARRKIEKEAADKRESAQDLLDLADTVAVDTSGSGHHASAAAAGRLQQQQQVQQVDGVERAAAGGLQVHHAAMPGVLPDALVAAQQLLASGSVHPANVPGLGYTHVEWLWQQVGPNMSAAEAQRQLDAQRQQQSGLGGDLLRLEQELEDAYAEHVENAQQHKGIFKEMDVSLRVAPEALVGRAVRIYWELDDAWFLANVVGWDPSTGQHKVEYEDGDSAQLWMGIERVRLFFQPGEQLPLPNAAALMQLAQCYMEQAAQLEQQLQQKQAAGEEDSDADEEELEKPQQLRKHACVLLGTGHLKSTDQVPEIWRPPSKPGTYVKRSEARGGRGCRATDGSQRGGRSQHGLLPVTNITAGGAAVVAAPVAGAQEGAACAGAGAGSAAAGAAGAAQSGVFAGHRAAASEAAAALDCAFASPARRAAAPTTGQQQQPLSAGQQGHQQQQQQQQLCSSLLGVTGKRPAPEAAAPGPSPSASPVVKRRRLPAGMAAGPSQAGADADADAGDVAAADGTTGAASIPIDQAYAAGVGRTASSGKVLQEVQQQQLDTGSGHHKPAGRLQRNTAHSKAANKKQQQQQQQQQQNSEAVGAVPGQQQRLLRGSCHAQQAQQQQQRQQDTISAKQQQPKQEQQQQQQQQKLQTPNKHDNQQQRQKTAADPYQPVQQSAVHREGSSYCQEHEMLDAQLQGAAATQAALSCPAAHGSCSSDTAIAPGAADGPGGHQAAAAGRERRVRLDAAAGAGAGDCAGSSSNRSSVVMSVLPGEVVWVTYKTNPPWPALVITSEEATDFSIPHGFTRSPQVCVQYFGDYTRQRVSPSALLPACVALEQRVWLPTLLRKPSRLVDNYRLSLTEFITYCKTGELPNPEMVPEHNDERWLNDDQPPDALPELDVSNSRTDSGRKGKAAQGGRGGGYSAAGSSIEALRQWAAKLVALQQPGGAASAGAGDGTPKLPLQLAQNLTLLSLGRVEFLHPGFHSEKFIWPVGFSVRRRAKTPASGDRELWHVAEILESPDGSGPLFRITPQGCKPVSGSSPTAALQELYKVAGSSASAASAARAVSACGAKWFGLQHPAVQVLIQALQNAAACDRFMAWQGERPEPILLTSELLLAKRAIATRLLSLPPGIKPLPISRRIVGACDACGDETEAADNLLVECDCCRVMVHMRCYGMDKVPDGSSWLCDVCRLPGLSSPPPCVLCPRLGGAMKVTAEGGWCHLLCATWIPGMCVADQNKMEPIIGASRVGKDRRSLLCSVCSQPYGACIQCAGSSKCYAAFHPTCARDAGYPMAAVWDEDSEDEEEEGASAGAAASKGQGCDTQRNGASEQQQGKNKQSKRGLKPRKIKKIRKEGTAAGDNTRLFCFCPKHRQKAGGMEQSLIFKSSASSAAAVPGVALSSVLLPHGSSAAAGSSTAAGSAGATGAAGSGGQEVTSPHRLLPAGQQQAPWMQQAAAAAASAGIGSSAAAVAGQPPGPGVGVMLFGDGAAAAGTCARSRPADTAVRRGLRAPDALAAALRKRLYVRALPYLVTGCTRAGQLLPPPVCRGRMGGPEFAAAASQQHDGSLRSNGCNSSSSNVVGAAVAVLPHCAAVCAARALSLADRYEHMKATAASRLASGKSAIHGLGVFAKVPHKAGEMVVEYMGHLLHPRVADMLEARTYNQMVGAGTYIFRLNEDYCVDATRAGNIAHLINHSCEPSCYSRTITVRCPETAQNLDHVVIIAMRDIGVGEELTYDYRFCGDEKLRCNCGAAGCRGWVNTPASIESPHRSADGGKLLPKRELQPVKDLAVAWPSDGLVPQALTYA